MGPSHKLIASYSRWMREVLVNQSNFFSLLQFIGNSRIIEPGQYRPDYARQGIANRHCNGHHSGIQTIYGQLQNTLGVPVKPAPDEWDKLYNMDFSIEVGNRCIGLQIKPVTFGHTFEDYKWKQMQETTNLKFQKKFGGRVFTIFSTKVGKKKVIRNPEVIEEIRKEVERLKETT
jgi:hypothetical protein